MHPLASCCSLWQFSHWVQAAVSCLCLVFKWSTYPARNMAWLLHAGSLADLTSHSSLTGSADSLRWGVYYLYYRLWCPLLIPSGQANSSLLDNSLDPLKGCWGNFLGSSMSHGRQRLGVLMPGPLCISFFHRPLCLPCCDHPKLVKGVFRAPTSGVSGRKNSIYSADISSKLSGFCCPL